MISPTQTDSTEVTGQVLVVDDHAQARESMSVVLRHAGHQVKCCASAREALSWLQHHHADVVITDLQMPGMSGLELMNQLNQCGSDAQVLMVTAHATINVAVEAMRLGAFDFIEKPFDATQLESLVERSLASETVIRSPGELPELAPCMVGNSAPMRALRERIALVAATDETVLITGESGTGKELVAQSIHAASQRSEHTLVSLNCPALSPQLMESELFGHEQGAFTGAEVQRVGRFELADQGTILLDEITEIELPLQAKLLRVLQERSFERVGSSASRSANVRVLATTNRELSEEVAAGRFRQDLYFRLAVVPIAVPALRDRKEDIPALCQHFLTQAGQRLQRATPQLGGEAIELLQTYDWPGNVRELENVMTRAMVLCPANELHAEQLHPWLLGSTPEPQKTAFEPGVSLQEMERQLIEATLERFAGHRAKTAEALGIGIRTLSNKLRSYGYPPRAQFEKLAGEKIPA